jgi:hypothetical protein
LFVFGDVLVLDKGIKQIECSSIFFKQNLMINKISKANKKITLSILLCNIFTDIKCLVSLVLGLNDVAVHCCSLFISLMGVDFFY